MIIIRQLSEMYIEASELTEKIYSTVPTMTSYDEYSTTFAELLDETDYKTGLNLDMYFGLIAYAITKNKSQHIMTMHLEEQVKSESNGFFN